MLLTAYEQRNLPRINGVLRSIFADRLVDDRTGEAYFLAKVDVNPEDFALLDAVHLAPGMPADVMILIATLDGDGVTAPTLTEDDIFVIA